MYVKGVVDTWVVFVGVYGNMSPAVGVMRFVGWILYGLRWEKLEVKREGKNCLQTFLSGKQQRERITFHRHVKKLISRNATRYAAKMSVKIRIISLTCV